MSRLSNFPPAAVPVLSRGKHRSMRKGACFMEMASFVAGEPWSDHPRCTHPLLADLARHVNDLTSDAERHRLATLIPSVVGLTSDDPRVDARIALRCACTALPVASEERQRALAVAVLTAERVLAQLEGTPSRDPEPMTAEALASAPHAAVWGEQFVRRAGLSVKGFRRTAAPNAVRLATLAIAEACAPDRDAILRRLLVDAIDECEQLFGRGNASSVAVPDVASRSASADV